jgi:hypothetical protein
LYGCNSNKVSKDSQSYENRDDLKISYLEGYNIVGEFNEEFLGKNEDRAALNSLNSLLKLK